MATDPMNPHPVPTQPALRREHFEDVGAFCHYASQLIDVLEARAPVDLADANTFEAEDELLSHIRKQAGREFLALYDRATREDQRTMAEISFWHLILALVPIPRDPHDVDDEDEEGTR